MTRSQDIYLTLRCWREILFGVCLMVWIPGAIFWWLSFWASWRYLVVGLFGWGVWNYCLIGMVWELVLFDRVDKVKAELGMEEDK